MNSNLSNNYEIFFQPLLNGDNPDIVLLRKNSGVMIIEVKDWNLDHYRIDSNKNWELRIDRTKVKSPISQVLTYKQNLYELHIESLLEKNIKNPKMFSIVTCALYFHNSTSVELKSFLTNDFKNDNNYIKFLNYFELLGRDSINENNFKSILHSRFLDRSSKFLDDTLYNSFKKHLTPPFHKQNEGIFIDYIKKQKELIESKDGEYKLKGVAGSGKTFVLAKRAVNAHIKTKDKVLILTFNITLRNYIHDKISQVRESFNWSNFYIIHYHQFITIEMNNYSIPISIPNNFEELSINEREQFFNQIYSDENLFESAKHNINKYKTIIIDEVQDYETSWIKIIKKYFWDKTGEFVVCGDEKQNIYERLLDNKLPNTTITGRWNELNQTFRFTTNIANLAVLFQKEFFIQKYELDEFEIIAQRDLEDQTNIIEYYFLDNNNIDIIYKRIKEILEILKLHPNEVCIIGNSINIVREIDYMVRKNLHQKTTTMFETKEIYEYLKEKRNGITNRFENEIEKVRKYKKFNFWMNSGLMKLSTIHSFKGWEIHTLILIIDEDESGLTHVNDELIYTGMTRCRRNLIILNLHNNKYHNFFQKNTEKIF